jgi:hypothetical protein
MPWWSIDPRSDDDDLTGVPPSGNEYKWGVGVALPVILVYYGISMLASGEATFYDGRYSSMPLHGANARAYAISILSVAVFAHCHYFWGNVYEQLWFAVLGKIISAIGFIAGLGFLIVHLGLMGWQ